MQKILVADLLGTLIPYPFDDMHYLYGDSNIERTCDPSKEFVNIDEKKTLDCRKYEDYLLEKSILKLKILLEHFFKENNNLYIVSAIHSHGALDFFTNTFFSKIYELLHEYSDNIFFFESIKDMNKLNEIKRADGFSKIEENVAYFDNGMKIHIINRKEQVYKYIKNLYPSRLYAIGDDAQADLGMLLKCIELGGKSSFIVKNLYDFDLRKEINRYVYNNFLTNYNYDMFSSRDREFIRREDVKIKEKIYNDIAGGNLEIMDIVENNLFYEIKEYYNYLSLELDRDHKRINDISMISKIQIYPSFSQFASDNLLNNTNKTIKLDQGQVLRKTLLDINKK